MIGDTKDVPAADRSVSRAGIAALVLLTALLGWPLLVGKVYWQEDLSALNLPLRHFYQQALQHGESVLWWPAIYGGVYLQGEGEGGFFHPLHFLLYSVLPLGPGMMVELLAAYLLTAFGALTLLRRLGLTSGAAWFGALTWAFSGFMTVHVRHPNLIGVMAHLPWLLYGVVLVMRSENVKPRVWGAALIAALVASQALLGHPQMLWTSGLGVAAVCLVLAVASRRWAPFAWVVAAALLGATLGAVQLLPTADFANASTRVSASVDFVLDRSLHPGMLLQMWVPSVFREPYATAPARGVYAGASTAVLLCWFLVRPPSRDAKGTIFLAAGTAIAAIVLALGRYGLVYRAQVFLPLAGRFRAPDRYIVLADVAFTVVAAIAFADLQRIHASGEKIPWRRLWPLGLPLTAGLFGVIVLEVWKMLRPGSWIAGQLAAAPVVAGGLLIVVAATGVVTLAARAVPRAMLLLLAFVALDLGTHGLRSYLTAPPSTMPAILSTLPSPPQTTARLSYGQFNEKRRSADHSDPRGRLANTATMRGIRAVEGFLALIPRRTLDYRRPAALRVANVEWRWDGTNWLRVEAPLPRVRLFGRVQQTRDASSDLDRIDVQAVALVHEPLELERSEPGTATVEVDRPGDIRVRTVAPARQLLFISESFHQGWHATIDGHPAKTVRVDGDFFGSVVGAGTHTVEFRFAPVSFTRGARISAAAAVLFLLLSAVAAVRFRTRPVDTAVS